MSEINHKEIEKIIGYNFSNHSLLSSALTHSTIESQNNNNGGVATYQRLEFLGDALLDFIVAEELFRKFPHFDEGDLTRMRAAIVSKTPLAKVVSGAGLCKYIVKVNLSNDTMSEKVKSDIFESLIAAIYLDCGDIALARKFVYRFLGDQLSVAKKAENFDYKSKLIEYCVSKNYEFKFECDDVDGPPHALVFKYSLYIEGKRVATASGSTKRAAQQECARQGCESYGI